MRHQAFISGEFVDAASSETPESFNPTTDAVLANVAAFDVEDVT
ncbi:MAG: acyl-CoA reductase-like NAD-dependent aldehyde dehydrogenase [bacterium]